MADRVRPTGSRFPSKQPAPPPPAPPRGEGPKWKRPFQLTLFRWKLPKGANWLIYLAIGVAVFAVAGYLVAALLFFPAPLLSNERAVGRVIGMNAREAASDLQQSGLRDSIIGREPHPSAAPGTVIWQDPPAGVVAPRGSLVGLILSSGEPQVSVPDVRGYDEDIARQLLAAAGLRVDGVDSVDTKDTPSGLAGGTSPGAGDRLTIGRAVLLHLAR